MKLFAMDEVYTSRFLLLPAFLFALGWNETAIASEKHLSVWGGFFYTEAAELEGFSDGTSANLPVRTVFRPNPEEGWFGGLSIGSGLTTSLLGFQQIDLYFEGQATEEDSDGITSIGVGSIPYVTGLAAGIGPVPLTALAKRERYEIGITLSDFEGEGFWQSLQITPFAGIGSEHAVSTGVFTGFNLTTNTTDLDWRFVGILVGAEQALNLGEGLDLVFQGAAGPYSYEADGKIVGTYTGSSSSLSLSGTGTGLRAKSKIELRKMINQTIGISIFGGVDYWSATPYTQLKDPSIWNFSVPVKLGTDSITDWSVGVKMTVKLGG